MATRGRPITTCIMGRNQPRSQLYGNCSHEDSCAYSFTILHKKPCDHVMVEFGQPHVSDCAFQIVSLPLPSFRAAVENGNLLEHLLTLNRC